MLIKFTINPTQSESKLSSLGECVYWLNKLQQRLSKMGSQMRQPYEKYYIFERVFTLGIILIKNLNLNSIDKETMELIKDLVTNKDFMTELSKDLIVVELLKRPSNKKLQELQLFKKDENQQESIFLDFYYKSDMIYQIKCISTQQDINNSYELADKVWAHEQRSLASRISSNRLIQSKFIQNQQSLIKKNDRIIKESLIVWSLQITLDDKLTKEFINNSLAPFSIQNNSLFTVYYTMQESIRNVINTYYEMKIENPLDFHYLLNQALLFVEKYENYDEFIKKSITDYKKDDKINKHIYEQFIKSRKEIEELQEILDQWKQANTHAFKPSDNLLKKNRKILALKFVKKGFISRAQIIAKKRAGLKKQRALQEKSEKLKICLLYTSPSPRDRQKSRMPSSA
eukprot:TRINITY_DN4775_c0_g1_i2.p1 TRINITY_DN4775_c0_g1~~TRINITY_DN4775_c0_g1_i2.p1  ORF type:complete len:400 (-),score=81.01 TRINITY_DN4775_c0_g1_i2:32-1231(-)